MQILWIAIALVVGIAVGVGIFAIYNKSKERGGQNKADEIVRKAKHEA